MAGMGAQLGILMAMHVAFTVCWQLFESLGWVLTVCLGLLRWVATFGQRRAMKRSGKTCMLELFGLDVFAAA